MKKIYLFLLGLMLCTSCTQKVVFKSKTYNKTASEGCVGKTNCAVINLAVLEAKDNENVSDSINKSVFESIREMVYAGEEPTKIKNYNDLMGFFIEDFNEMKTDLKQQEIVSWEAKVKVLKTYESDRILNLVVESYVYMGGAHGYESIQSLCFDAETGEKTPAKSLFTDNKKVSQLVEKYFRINQKLKANINYTEAGYTFENNVFVLPENINFTDKGLKFHYNPYEVASYAQGEIEFEIPYAEIEQFLKIKR